MTFRAVQGARAERSCSTAAIRAIVVATFDLVLAGAGHWPLFFGIAGG